MSKFTRFLGGLFGWATPNVPNRRASFDAARTTKANAKHWANADGYAPVTQLTPNTRNTLARRALYECQNNPYAVGMIRTLVGDTVGTAPRLQMLEDDQALNESVEELWGLWCGLTDMRQKFRIIAGVKYVTGEGFGLFRESKKLDALGFPVPLDVKLVEPEQVTHGLVLDNKDNGDDGIVCDDDDEVIAYKVLKRHPGDLRTLVSLKPETVPAKNVIHWFQPERPGQLRGYTPLASALPIFAQLRRFTSATLTAAEFAAMISGVIESDLPFPNSGSLVKEEDEFSPIEFVQGSLLTLPSGLKAKGFDPTQPTTTYEMFVNAKLREIGRCQNIPFGKIAGDHSRYNYSSGRLDDGAYWADRYIERDDFRAKVLDPVFVTFLNFARFALPALAAYKGNLWAIKHTWHYDAKPSADPVKDATADEINLANGTDTLSGIAARDGTTAEELLRQRERDLQLFQKYNLPLPAWAVGASAPVRVSPDQQQTNQQPEGAAA